MRNTTNRRVKLYFSTVGYNNFESRNAQHVRSNRSIDSTQQKAVHRREEGRLRNVETLYREIWLGEAGMGNWMDGRVVGWGVAWGLA